VWCKVLALVSCVRVCKRHKAPMGLVSWLKSWISSDPYYTAPPAIASKWFPEFVDKLPEQTGKVVAVTGSTTGTGFVCALTCAKKGAHVVLLNRPSERATEAERRIKELAPQATVETIPCDLMDFASVRAAAATLKSKFGGGKGLDVLCCNAGVMALKDQATSEGYDVQMQTNHLAHFLLAKEVFGLLEAAAKARGEARIVNHSSGARHMAKQLEAPYLGVNGGNLGGDGASMFLGGARWVRYGQTKLANAVWTQALHEKLQARDSPVKAVCAAPGLAATNLQVTTHLDGGMAATWIMSMSQSAEDGTMPLLQCCIGTAHSGEFIEPSKGMWGVPAVVAKRSAKEIDPAATKLIWEMSEKACGEWKL